MVVGRAVAAGAVVVAVSAVVAAVPVVVTDSVLVVELGVVVVVGGGGGVGMAVDVPGSAATRGAGSLRTLSVVICANVLGGGVSAWAATSGAGTSGVTLSAECTPLVSVSEVADATVLISVGVSAVDSSVSAAVAGGDGATVASAPAGSGRTVVAAAVGVLVVDKGSPTSISSESTDAVAAVCAAAAKLSGSLCFAGWGVEEEEVEAASLEAAASPPCEER